MKCVIERDSELAAKETDGVKEGGKRLAQPAVWKSPAPWKTAWRTIVETKPMNAKDCPYAHEKFPNGSSSKRTRRVCIER